MEIGREQNHQERSEKGIATAGGQPPTHAAKTPIAPVMGGRAQQWAEGQDQVARGSAEAEDRGDPRDRDLDPMDGDRDRRSVLRLTQRTVDRPDTRNGLAPDPTRPSARLPELALPNWNGWNAN